MALQAVDEAYMMACTGLVLFMIPGLALFYGGLARKKGAVDMLIQNFAPLSIVSVLWYVVGFSIAYSPGDWVGDPWTYFMWRGLDINATFQGLTISGPLFATFQMMFANITPMLMTGAFADRMYFGPFCIFVVLWHLLVYCPWCHQMCGGGYLMQAGAVDFAGGVMVHQSSGWSALGACLALGHRKVKYHGDHSLPMIVGGTGILWWGWFGFNGGSALMANSTAVGATINSQLAAAAGMCAWGLVDWTRSGKAKLVPMCIGSVAGLVVITPLAGFVSMRMAVLSGVVATAICYPAVILFKLAGCVDDALDVWSVHGLGGTVGTLLVGLVSNSPECLDVETAPKSCIFPGSIARSNNQFCLQLEAAFFNCTYCVVVTFFLIKFIGLFCQFRPEEIFCDDLDIELHGEAAYNLPVPEESTMSLLVNGES